MSAEDNKIEQLKRRLFSNSGGVIPPTPRPRLQKHQVLVKEAWENDPESLLNLRGGTESGSTIAKTTVANSGGNIGPTNIGKTSTPGANSVDLRRMSSSSSSSTSSRTSLFKKILGWSIIVFVLAAAFAGYKIFTGENFVSNNNIDIRLLGPVTSPAGEELSLDVDITNRNSTELILADLVITYPEGTRNADDRVTPLTIERIDLGTIGRGQTIRQTIRSVLFGEENTKKNIKIALEYRVEGSANVFVREKDFPIFIGSSPITVNVESTREAIPEEEHVVKITIRSNSASIVKGLVFKAEYPFGFDFTSAVPTPASDKQTWILGDMQPEEERQIIIRGKMSGGREQERIFRFYTGTEDASDKTEIGTIFVTNSTQVVLKKPFISTDLSLDGKTDAIFIGKAGNEIRGEITWQNNLDVPLTDVVLEARITGDMLDESKVRGDRGFYQSVTDTIVWDKTTFNKLKEIQPNDIGRIQFAFATLKPTVENNANFRRQSLKVELAVKAKRLDEDNVPEEITSNVVRTVKIESDVALSTRLVRSVGPFENTGPIPPEPEKPTTYTVLVSLKNSYNLVKDAVYTATLPQYVTWLGQTYPNGSGVSYNADKRQITWQVGDIQPGTGYSASAKEFAYQVSFLPSIGQVGTTPEIILEQKILGKDNFTGQVIETTVAPLDIKTETEPGFEYGDDKVGGS